MALSGKQRRTLRALGHHLRPVVQVGHSGVTDALVAALEQALHDHELVKVKVSENAPGTRAEIASALAASTGSEVAQLLGRTALLYRPRPDDPKIVL
ncbi:MAG TPA: ribosome assembly RNA-binding protein YhbY [Myxococcaceae bacterium]|nr:ribosome assembly RNA-binding protein YhbY [Myxococcaceae bacterium]